MNRIAAVVTTYNRLSLLKENIEALLNQSYSKLDILVINNNSTDETEAYVTSLVDKRIKYYNTGSNLGGAGGFAFGLARAIESGYEYAWIMDDDTIPTPQSLEILVDKSNHLHGEFSFLCSTVYWTDGSQFPMNTPSPEPGFQQSIAEVVDHHLIRVSTCSFVGCFINLEYAEKVGLPYAEYFIYGDDVEYTTRLHEAATAYWVLDSKLIHKAPSKVGSNIILASPDRIDRFYMQTRNGIHSRRMHGNTKGYLVTLLRRIKHVIRESPNYKLKRINTILRGIIAGFFFNPPIKYVKKNDE